MGPIYLAKIVLIKTEDLEVDFVLYNREKTCERIILLFSKFLEKSPDYYHIDTQCKYIR